MQRRLLRIIARMNVGGPALEVAHLMRGLPPADFDQVLLTGQTDTWEADYLETQAPDLEFVRVPGLGRAVRPTDDVIALYRISAMMRAFKPHIVHTHTAKAGALGRLAARLVLPSARVVHTFHGHVLNGYFSPTKNRIITTIERRLAVTTDRLITVGSAIRDELLALGIGDANRYSVIPPGLEVHPGTSRFKIRSLLGFTEDAFVVAFIGRLTHIKRVDRFVDVVQLVAGQNPRVRFLVAGDGELSDFLTQEKHRRDLPITILGWRSDVDDLLRASDAALLTSDNEGTPITLMQAAFAGIPSVATDVGAVREVVSDGRTGLLTSRDAQEIATTLLTLADRPGYAAILGEQAKVKALSDFTRSRFLEQHLEVYDQVCP